MSGEALGTGDYQGLDRMGDGVLRACHRIAKAEPDKPWPAHVVADLADELIRRRGRDTAWLATHTEET